MQLSLKDLRHIYFCTGARNEKLLNFFDPEKISFEIDERVASFKALGRAKVEKSAVAICTTSGTAVSECLSALIEAKYSNVPIILISGDRPKKLHGTGSPQTINHQQISSYLSDQYFEVTLNELEDFKWTQSMGPVHINVLIDDTIAHSETPQIHEDFLSFENFISNKKCPLFLISHEQDSMREFIEKFKSLGIPFYAETLSHGRDLSPLLSEKELIMAFNQSDSVVRIGHTPLSKIWRLLEKKPLPVFSFDNRGLAGLSFGEVLKMSSQELLSNDLFFKLVSRFSGKKNQSSLEEQFHALIKSYPESEVSYFHKIQEMIPEGSYIYLGNSLVIRFFELVQRKRFHVFGNRGVNGIDGQLSTACGIAQGLKTPLYCILGDMTTKYDLSALENLPENLKLIIINNKGGRIFDMLKLDSRIILSHEKHFKKITEAFDLSYSNNLSDLDLHQVIELCPDQNQTRNFLGAWER